MNSTRKFKLGGAHFQFFGSKSELENKSFGGFLEWINVGYRI